MDEETTTRGRDWSAPRTRGMVSGIGLMLLGAWGAIIPFIGSHFNYTYTPDHSWDWTSGRGYLEVLPGALAVLAGLGLIITKHRATGSIFAWFGVLAGAWFVVGPLIAPTWDANAVGTPVGGTRMTAVEQIGIFFGLGAAIVLLAATAVGRFSMNVAPVAEPAHEPFFEPMPAEPAGYQRPTEYQRDEALVDREPADTAAMAPVPMYSAPLGGTYGAASEMTNGPVNKGAEQRPQEESEQRHRGRLFGRHHHAGAH